jgi:hypothetical protein
MLYDLRILVFITIKNPSSGFLNEDYGDLGASFDKSKKVKEPQIPEEMPDFLSRLKVVEDLLRVNVDKWIFNDENPWVGRLPQKFVLMARELMTNRELNSPITARELPLASFKRATELEAVMSLINTMLELSNSVSMKYSRRVSIKSGPFDRRIRG